MGLLRDVRELLMPRVCPVCGHLMTDCEDVVCAFCAIGLPRYINVNPNDNPNDNEKAAEQARPKVNENENPNPNPTLNPNENLNENENENQNERFWDNVLLRAAWSKADVRRGTTLMVYNHDSPYHRLVVAIKFMDKRELAVKLGRWAAMEAGRQGFWQGVDALVPVPLTRWRRFCRGYNQAEMLARGMAEVTGLPVLNLIGRTKNRKPQSRLNGMARIRNAEGIYEASVPDEWRGKRLVVVDDVMTTGATMANCALALKNADKYAEICIFPLAYAGK
ncbi:MAG: ComF family protein [Bacteroidaceae bacterium]|nr:ComF family protein [Bacteroidaceae bacterium]